MHVLNNVPCGGSTSRAGVPNNWLGYQFPQSGDGYIALHTYAAYGTTDSDAHEYARSYFEEPLTVGRGYTFSMYVIHANEQRFYSNGLGVYLSLNECPFLGHEIFREPNFYIEDVIYPDSFWQKFTWTFTAEKPYTSLVLGRFFRTTDDRFVFIDGKPNEPLPNGKGVQASYYIDNVSLVAEPVPELDLGEDRNGCSGLILESPMKGEQYLWSNGSNQSSISIENSGIYWLEVTRFGEKRRDTIEVEVYNNYRLFPVPTVQNLTLELASELDRTLQWEVLDMIGRLVIQGSTTLESGRHLYDINLSKLDSGAYFYRFTTPCGEFVMERFIFLRE